MQLGDLLVGIHLFQFPLIWPSARFVPLCWNDCRSFSVLGIYLSTYIPDYIVFADLSLFLLFAVSLFVIVSTSDSSASCIFQGFVTLRTEERHSAWGVNFVD